MKFFIKNIFSNQNPIVHHCPENNPEKIWKDMVKLSLKNNFDLNKPKDLSIITFNNTNKKMILEKNLDLLKSDYFVLGKNIKTWKNTLKISLLKEFLLKIKTNFVLVLDAEDVIISNEISKIIEKFKKFNCKVLYNASSCIYPNENFYSSLEKNMVKKLFCHLNSGCFIGYTGYCQKLYSDIFSYEDNITKKHYYSDQIKVKKFYTERHPEIQIDSECKIFQVWNVKSLNLKCKDVIKLHNKIL